MIAQKINTVFENAVYDCDINKIEAIFQGLKITEGAPGKVTRLLEFILECRLKKNGEANKLLEKLLRIINANNLLVKDKEALEQLNIRCENIDDYEFKIQVNNLNARILLNKDKNEGFRQLLNLSHNYPNQHEMLCSALKMQDEFFYEEYFKEIYLPEYTTNLESLLLFLKDNKNLDEDTYNVLLSRTLHIVSEKLGEFTDIEELSENKKKVQEILDLIPDGRNLRKKECTKKINFFFWKGFSSEKFDPKKIGLYKECGVEEASKTNYKREECINAKRLWNLIQLFEEGMTRDNLDRLKEVLFSDKILSGKEEKERVRQSLLTVKRDGRRMSADEEFDYLLLLFYNCTENRFEVLEWIKEAENRNLGMRFELEPTKRYIRNSKVLKDEKVRNNLIAAIENELRRERKNPAGKYNRKQRDELKTIYSCLTGKNAKKHYGDGGKEFLFTLHRVPVGMFALSAVAFWFICLQRYMELEPVIIHGAAIFLSFAGAVAVIMKIARHDGILEWMESRGLDSVLRWLSYIGVFLMMAVIIAAVFFLPGILAKMIGIFVLSLLSVISVITYGVWKKR